MSDSLTADILARHRHALGPTYGLFYEEPVHLVRAEGVWMYDVSGRAYLDAYNNVPVVGHGHPEVVEAIARQARTLNTHTRYVTDQPLALAERLLATMPKDIGNMVFTCSGSEANDLAVRISKAVTGGTGFMVTEHAYHGTSETTAGMSPAAGVHRGPGVYTVPAPLGPNGPANFAEAVRLCIARMRTDGTKPAGLLVDTNFSSDGVISDPAGFLAAAAHHIRAAGGLFIADEVQPGFGRTGEHMWGFQRHGVTPDIVTMGKPMGNGHPVAAMATRPEIMAAFAKLTRYFNTFGGNTVSCAAGLAVLDVLAKEKLIDNARTTGAYLRAGLEKLARRHEAVGEIRGTGLFLGVDIKANPSAGLTARQETARIVNSLRRHGALIGSAGRNVDVLKIRPPLPFSPKDADLLLGMLDQALGMAAV